MNSCSFTSYNFCYQTSERCTQNATLETKFEGWAKSKASSFLLLSFHFFGLQGLLQVLQLTARCNVV